MNTHFAQETPLKMDGRHPQDTPYNAPVKQSLDLLGNSTALSARELEDRRVIHRNDSSRKQADAFRELRTRLLALGGSHNFVTLVAPVMPGCGGSFVARNLAAAFAFDDSKSALLVDCDALHPAQQSALRVDASQGGLID